MEGEDTSNVVVAGFRGTRLDHAGLRNPLCLVALAGLFLGGLAHWLWFYGQPGVATAPYTAADWPVANRYAAVLQQSVREGRIPYYISRSMQNTRKFLADPEVLWSPEVVLLGAVSVTTFHVAHTLLLYAVGFLGCLLLARRWGLSLLPFAFLVLLFDFNGHITAHLAVGHAMWTGYFLLPFFVSFVLELMERPVPSTPLKLALVLFAILLQGAWHLFVWCILFLALLAVFNRNRARVVLTALIWSALLGTCRLLPSALVLYEKQDQVFLSGYPGVGDLLAALWVVRGAAFERRGGLLGTLNWWEYDAYVGLAGLAFLAWYGIFRRRPGVTARFGGLYGPMFVMFALSLGDLFYPFNRLPVPLLSSERVSSRFLVLPLVFLIVLSALSLQLALEESGQKPGLRWGLRAAAVLVAASLGLHSYTWRIEAVESALRPPRPRDLTIAVADPPANPGPRDVLYLAGTRLGVLCSLGACALLARKLWRESLIARPLASPESVHPTLAP